MIIFVTGGARSGKSSFAESLFQGEKDVVYIATSVVEDEEMKDRVDLHRAGRPRYWRTFEDFEKIYRAIGPEENYILDCVTVLSSNIMFRETEHMERIGIEKQDQLENMILDEIEFLIRKLGSRDYKLVLVSNELGASIVPGDHISRVFRDVQGRVNQRLAEISDQAYLLVSGLPVRLK